jgi:Fur family transcriptional regulator, peroxide stress response regulator
MIKTKQYLQSNGLKATPQRIAVYKAMKILGHASADMVYQKVIEEYPTLTVATIYNILESFVKAGIISRLSSSNIKMYFDINTYPHCHIYSESGNYYADLDDDELMDIITEHLKKKKIAGFTPSTIEVRINGEFLNNINQ